MFTIRLQFFRCALLASSVAVGIASTLFAGAVQAGDSHSPALVQVEGRRVEAEIEGAGSPAVVFESGFIGGLFLWEPVQTRVAQETLTLTYERAGLGQSDPGPDPRSAEQIAKELHALLSAKAIAPPYVLVGHSAGGLFVRVFAHMYPKEIAGLVLVDPATEQDYERLRTEKTTEEVQKMGMPSAAVAQWIALPETLDQARRAWPLPHVPTVVFTSGKALGAWPLATDKDMQEWLRSHNQLVEKIAGSKHIILEKADHISILKEPAVTEQILKTVAAARARGK
jgi:pimeloyl-ACP methyl ester carboxylesterase